MKILPLGKAPWDILAQIVQMQGFTENKGVIQTSESGVDVAVLNLREIINQINETYQTESIPHLVYKADPITFPTPNPAKYLIMINKNDLATAGALPYGITSTILLPPSTSESFLLELQNELSDICEKERITILGGHTEVTNGVNNPILSASMIGFVPPEYYIPREPQMGDAIICSGWVGAEGTGILLSEERKFFLDKIGNSEYQNGIEIGRQIDVSHRIIECNKRWHDQLHLVHDCTEGGVLGAIFECLSPKGFGCDIDLEKVPLAPVTSKIAATLRINPYKLISSGAVIIVCSNDKASNIKDFLSRNGFPTAIIGKIDNTSSKIYVNGAVCDPPEADHLIKGLNRLNLMKNRV